MGAGGGNFRLYDVGVPLADELDRSSSERPTSDSAHARSGGLVDDRRLAKIRESGFLTPEDAPLRRPSCWVRTIPEEVRQPRRVGVASARRRQPPDNACSWRSQVHSTSLRNLCRPGCPAWRGGADRRRKHLSHRPLKRTDEPGQFERTDGQSPRLRLLPRAGTVLVMTWSPSDRSP